jgi:hypothetical protein
MNSNVAASVQAQVAAVRAEGRSVQERGQPHSPLRDPTGHDVREALN